LYALSVESGSQLRIVQYSTEISMCAPRGLLMSQGLLHQRQIALC
jgi:hypothetical protein